MRSEAKEASWVLELLVQDPKTVAARYLDMLDALDADTVVVGIEQVLAWDDVRDALARAAGDASDGGGVQHRR